MINKTTPSIESFLISQYKGLYATNTEVRCRAGWHDILKSMSSKIQQEASQLQITPGHEDYPQILTIKEKFGLLRVYFHTNNSLLDEKITAIVAEATQASKVTCDVCGQSGALFLDGRIMKTRCAQHTDD